jgi:hypothetical protein
MGALGWGFAELSWRMFCRDTKRLGVLTSDPAGNDS